MLRELSGNEGSGHSSRSPSIDDETIHLLNVPEDYVHARRDLVHASVMGILGLSGVKRLLVRDTYKYTYCLHC